jgi:hypothetical protein
MARCFADGVAETGARAAGAADGKVAAMPGTVVAKALAGTAANMAVVDTGTVTKVNTQFWARSTEHGAITLMCPIGSESLRNMTAHSPWATGRLGLIRIRVE